MKRNLMSFLFGGSRERSNVKPVTPFGVEPASVPSPEAAAAAERGRNHLLSTITRSEKTVASIHRRIVDDALARVRDN